MSYVLSPRVCHATQASTSNVEVPTARVEGGILVLNMDKEGQHITLLMFVYFQNHDDEKKMSSVYEVL